ncbi:hypothetical protein [uncultured Methanobrevibacter sp.]|uniref:hypothetical protein n=1 Tax=uncultured Methanobrevibacter sp. TaxID=253161 RepID=UPI0025D24B43|nr:hypothetical protein [uncultured Methanobrevibacter sp.]
MKFIKLFEQYMEDIVLESFQNDIIRTIVPQMNSNYSKSKFMWDKVTDDDIEQTDIETAKKLARKRKEDNVIIWMLDNKFIAVTSGTWAIIHTRTIEGRSSINTVANCSNTAYIFKNAEKFESAALQRERAQARSNALALRDNVEIAADNIKRYKTELNKMRTISDKDVLAALEKGLTAYEDIVRSYKTNLLKQIEEQGNLNPYSTNIWKANDEFNKVNKTVNSLLTVFREFSSDSNNLSTSYGNKDMNYMYAKGMKENADKVISISNNLQQIAADTSSLINKE